jgi:hypothetical protein
MNYSQCISDRGIETRRLVALLLGQSELSVTPTHPTGAFREYRGYFYLNASGYHCGAASFSFSSDASLARQANAERESNFRKNVERGQNDFARVELAPMRLRGALRRARARLKV